MTPNITEEEALRQFVEHVVKESGARGVDVDSAVEAISQRIDEGIVDALPEGLMDEMIELSDKGEMTDEKMVEMLDASGVDPKPIVERVMMAFRNKMMEGRAA